jgi:hypothetical protein
MPMPLLTDSRERTANVSFSLLSEHREAVITAAERLQVTRSEVVRRAIEEFARKNT